MLRKSHLRDNFTRLMSLALLISLFVGCYSASGSEGKGKVHILLVADTDASGSQVIGLGLDGRNMKKTFNWAFAAAGKEKEYTLKLLSGFAATPRNILAYYQSLNAKPKDTLVFYYTGHAITDRELGHLLTLRRGNITRQKILKEMKSHKPKLLVMLTDCCANYRGSSFFGPFFKGEFQSRSSGVADIPDPKESRKPREEEFPRRVDPTPKPRRIYPNPKPRDNSVRKPIENQPGEEEGFRPRRGRAAVASAYSESEDIEPKPRDPSPEMIIVKKSDLLTHLFFQHKGIVDINSSKVGKSSSGNARLGGSYFTLAFVKLLRRPVNYFDKNDNKIAEWEEFFPHLDILTDREANRGRFSQRPVAFQLAKVME